MDGKNKKCKRCNKTKLESDFSWRNDNKKFRNDCKECCSAKNQIRYHEQSLKQKKKNNRKNYLKSREKQLKYKKDFYHKNKNNPFFKNKKRQYCKKHERKRRKNDRFYTIRKNISRSVRKRLFNENKRKYGKEDSIFAVAPWLRQDLLLHLRNLYEDWMTDDNYGQYNSITWDDNDSSTWKWNIDHVIPQSDLPYDSIYHPNFKKCWALKNLRPYSAKQNYLDGLTRIRHKNNKETMYEGFKELNQLEGVKVIDAEKAEENQDDSVNFLPGPGNNSATKITYIVKVEDLTLGRKKYHTFVAAKVDYHNWGISLIGYKIDNEPSKDIKSEKDAVTLIDKGNKELYSISYPWSRVISVRNVSYRRKK